MNGEVTAGRWAFVSPGIELLDGLARLHGAEAWLQGTGYVESVELRVATEEGEAVTVLRGRFNLLALSGPSGGPFSVTLARLADAGLQVLGGELQRARSAGVNVFVQSAVRTTADASAVVPGGPATWASAAAASAAAAREEDQADEPAPEAGDWVQHFAFGLCEVLSSDGDRLRIRDIDGPRRVREVALSMLRVTGPTESDGKRLFHLARRGAP